MSGRRHGEAITGLVYKHMQFGALPIAYDEIIYLPTFKDYKSKEIVDYMHEEKAYTDTVANQVIPFSLSKKLNELE